MTIRPAVATETAATPAASSRTLRIAVMALGRYSGGSPIGLHLTRALAGRAVVRAFVGREAVNLSEWHRAGLEVDVHSTYTSAAGAVASLVWPRRLRRLARAIRAFAPDVVLVPFIHLWTLPLMRRIGVPAVVFIHDPDPHPGVAERFWHVLNRAIARRAAFAILHSRRFVPQLRERYGLDLSRIRIVPIGPLTDYAAEGDADRLPSRARTPLEVLCFGRMEGYKGVDVLLRAAAAIRRAVPEATIRIAGGGMDPSVKARAVATAGVRVDDGWIAEAEVPAYFRRAAVVVLPYTSATQSGVIPIAAAFGVPVIASNVGGLSEQLADGACGVLVPAGDAGALAAAVVELLRDPARAAALGAALHEEYHVRRSWTIVAAEVLAACTAAADRTGG